MLMRSVPVQFYCFTIMYSYSYLGHLAAPVLVLVLAPHVLVLVLVLEKSTCYSSGFLPLIFAVFGLSGDWIDTN
jgi:hypothetical protein